MTTTQVQLSRGRLHAFKVAFLTGRIIYHAMVKGYNVEVDVKGNPPDWVAQLANGVTHE